MWIYLCAIPDKMETNLPENIMEIYIYNAGRWLVSLRLSTEANQKLQMYETTSGNDE